MDKIREAQIAEVFLPSLISYTRSIWGHQTRDSRLRVVRNHLPAMTLTQDEALSSKDTISIDKDMAAVTITDVSSPSSLQTSESDELFLHSWRLAAVIGSLCLGIFLLALDMNIIAVAIPRITSDFHALNDVAWYGSAYLLTVTAFQPLFGNLYKYFDPKMVYMGSIVLFERKSFHRTN